MSSDSGDAEIRAIEQVIGALDPLDADARERVLEYAFKRLGIDGMDRPQVQPNPIIPQVAPPSPILPGPSDIRALREEKKPKSANEMAAVVGYYLAEIAPASERKREIGTPDIEKYFKQAQQRLPEAPGKTLPNALAAGYFDSAGRGLYSLNPVGFNLVAHGLPRESSSSPSPRRRSPKSKAKGKRKSAAKPKKATRRKAS
jgi:hypothetical protein